jgi:undecaprenyl-diphosphatase
LRDIQEAEWGWFPLVVLCSFTTYLGASIAMLGSVPERLRFGSTLEAQIGASFVNRISPVKVGGMATNLRYLQKSGIDAPVAVAGIGVASVVGFIVHMTLLVVFVTTAGRSAAESISAPSGQAVLVGLVVVMTLAGGVVLLPVGRRLVLDRLWPILKKSVAGIGNVASRPSKVLALFGGSFVITTSYILALWYSIEAFGGGISFVSVGAVYLGGQAIAQAAPTPGGIGAAEAALIAGLTGFGMAPEVAVPAVFLYRFATFWLPILPGWIAVRHLLRTGAL